MTKYEELKIFIADLQEGVGKLPWAEVEEERARMEKEIREAHANHQISGAQAGRLMKLLPRHATTASTNGTERQMQGIQIKRGDKEAN